MSKLKWAGALVAAALATTLAGTVVQTQFNLARLVELGVEVPAGVRLAVTGRDLAGFAPLLALLALAAFLVAFPVAGYLRRWVPQRRAAWYALAGAVGITAAFLVMQAIVGLVAIAAARGVGGFAALVACGALGGFVFARLTQSPPSHGTDPAG